MNKSREDFYLVKEVMDLNKAYEVSKSNHDSKQIISIIFKLRVIHGKMLIKLFNIKKDLSNLEQIGDRDLYDLSFYQSLTDGINNMITESEQNINSGIQKVESTKEEYNVNKPTLINFYTNTCQHSRNFLPVWDKLSTIIKQDKINLIKINCQEKKEICQKFNIKAYPTVKFFYKEVIYDFEGDRTVKNIISFLKDKIGDTSSASDPVEQSSPPANPLLYQKMAPPLNQKNLSKVLEEINSPQPRPTSPLMLQQTAPPLTQENFNQVIKTTYSEPLSKNSK
ncbi:Thioredoxin [seawater metagenome]|uniref:Thioredoxin n=1 Tax=seawater metagenome TaxID=1561972 RepID=A0A5E8CIS6_9ZZZZ